MIDLPPGTELRPPHAEDARLELKVGSDVRCGNTSVGELERLVTDPTTAAVTHLVILHDGRAVLVPVDQVERDEDEIIYLAPAACDLDRLPAYEGPERVQAASDSPGLGKRLTTVNVDDAAGRRPRRGWLVRALEGMTADRAGQPAVELSRRTEVVCTDGPAGQVHQVLLDRDSGVATHVVMRRGLRLPRDVVVPLSWARSITPERIELAVGCDELDLLPEYRPDEEIADNVLQRLHDTPQFQGVDLDSVHIEVNGGVVWLGGHVRSRDLRELAGEVATRVPGVLRVENALIADDELAAEVERALLADERLHAVDLQVDVLLGVVELRGSVATPDERDEAARVASRVPGVEAVTNTLEVRSSVDGHGRSVVAGVQAAQTSDEPA
jgi:osmotically-inducible protein OsmY